MYTMLAAKRTNSFCESHLRWTDALSSLGARLYTRLWSDDTLWVNVSRQRYHYM